MSYISLHKISSRKTIYDASILEQHFERRATKLYYFLGSVPQLTVKRAKNAEITHLSSCKFKEINNVNEAF